MADGTESTARTWERAWTLDEMRQNAGNWNLAGDAGLLKYLQEFSQTLLSRTHRTTESMDAMFERLDRISADVESQTNAFLALSNTQFVESRVYDDEEKQSPSEAVKEDSAVEVVKDKEKEKEEMVERIKEALHRGMDVMDSKYTIVQVPNSDSEDEEDHSNSSRIVLKAVDPYKDRPLPYRIGSEQFMKDPYIGLKPRSSPHQSESGSEDQKSLSGSESTISKDEIKETPHWQNDSPVYQSGDMFGSESPPLVETSHQPNFAEQLAQRLGGVATARPLDQSDDMFSPSGQSEDLFSPEPDDSLFGKYSGGRGLFGDIDQSGGLFDDVVQSEQVAKNESTSIYDSDDESIFAPKEKQLPSKSVAGNVKKDNIFGDDENQDDSLWSITATKDTSSKINDSIFETTNEDEDDLFSTNKKPAVAKPSQSQSDRDVKKPTGGVSIFGSNFFPTSEKLKDSKRLLSTGEETKEEKPSEKGSLSLAKDDSFEDEGLFVGEEKKQKTKEKSPSLFDSPVHKNVPKIPSGNDEVRKVPSSSGKTQQITPASTATLKSSQPKSTSLFDESDDDDLLFSSNSSPGSSNKPLNKSLFDTSDDLFGNSTEYDIFAPKMEGSKTVKPNLFAEETNNDLFSRKAVSSKPVKTSLFAEQTNEDLFATKSSNLFGSEENLFGNVQDSFKIPKNDDLFVASEPVSSRLLEELKEEQVAVVKKPEPPNSLNIRQNAGLFDWDGGDDLFAMPAESKAKKIDSEKSKLTSKSTSKSGEGKANLSLNSEQEKSISTPELDDEKSISTLKSAEEKTKSTPEHEKENAKSTSKTDVEKSQSTSKARIDIPSTDVEKTPKKPEISKRDPQIKKPIIAPREKTTENKTEVVGIPTKHEENTKNKNIFEDDENKKDLKGGVTKKYGHDTDDLFSNVNDVKKEPKILENLDKTSEKQIGKIKSPIGLSIDPRALLPGSKPSKSKGSQHEDVKSPEVENVAAASSAASTSKVYQPDEMKSPEKDNAVTVLPSMSKERARITTKRRPQSRKARQEAIRTSAIFPDDEATPSFGEITPTSDQDPPLTAGTPPISSKTTPSFEESTPTSDRGTPIGAKATPPPKRLAFDETPPSNVLSPSTDEEDLFGVPQDIYQEDNGSSLFPDSKPGLFSRDPPANLFSDEENLFNPVKATKTPPVKEEDKTATVPNEPDILAASEKPEPDIFKISTPKVQEVKSIPSTKVDISESTDAKDTKGLFDSGDIFGSSTSKKVDVVKKSSMKQSPAPVKTIEVQKKDPLDSDVDKNTSKKDDITNLLSKQSTGQEKKVTFKPKPPEKVFDSDLFGESKKAQILQKAESSSKGLFDTDDLFGAASKSPDIFADSAKSSNIFADSTKSPNTFADSTKSPNIFADSTKSPNIFADSTKSPNIFPVPKERNTKADVLSKEEDDLFSVKGKSDNDLFSVTNDEKDLFGGSSKDEGLFTSKSKPEKGVFTKDGDLFGGNDGGDDLFGKSPKDGGLFEVRSTEKSKKGIEKKSQGKSLFDDDDDDMFTAKPSTSTSSVAKKIVPKKATLATRPTKSSDAFQDPLMGGQND